MAKNVLIIGAGAAGLTAAISAARTGANVTVLEAQERPGRKLLVTGNGRCNLTNMAENLAEQYRGTGAALASGLIRKFGTAATLDFFHGMGLLTQVKNGYVYPYTGQSASVLEVLLAELRRLKVKVKFSQVITEIVTQSSTARFAVVTPTWTYKADTLILACGSKAPPSTGASGKGYLLAQKLGHTILNPRPALVPLISNASFLNRVAGVRCRAKITLLRSVFFEDKFVKEGFSAAAGKTYRELLYQENIPKYEEITHDVGELQWTNYGVSGIVIFQLSRYIESELDHAHVKTANKAVKLLKTTRVAAKTENSAYAISIDFFPEHSGQMLESLLTKRAAELSKEPVSVLLRGLLNEKLIPVVLDQTANLPEKSGALVRSDIIRLCHTLKAFLLPVTGTKSFEQAQICSGGVDCREVTEELESRLHSGLYFAGEMLDVDGPCGGYNLQWAWTSGFLAGASASREAI